MVDSEAEEKEMSEKKLSTKSCTLAFTVILMAVLISGCTSPSGQEQRGQPIPFNPQPYEETSAGGVLSKAFGGGRNDMAYSIQPTSDGGYIIAGETQSFGAGGFDAWLIKTDANFNRVWDKTFGGSDDDEARSVQQTSDGGYIIAGTKESYGAGAYDIWLIKTDASGNKLWEKTFGSREDNMGYAVQQTSDGGYIVTGTTLGELDYDIWLIKTDSNGNKLWDKVFAVGEDPDAGFSVLETPDSEYLILGLTSYHPGSDACLIKTDPDGNELWTRRFGGRGKDWDGGFSLQPTTDGGYIIAGYTASFGTGLWPDVWLIKTDADGNKLWDRTFGGESTDVGNSVQQTPDGGYVVAGYTASYGAGDWDAWLIKTDPSGNKLWDNTLGGSRVDVGNSVQLAPDGGYVVAGYTASYGEGGEKLWLIKTDADGNME
jgi:predicted secreted protein